MAKKNTQQPQEQFKTMIGGQALIEGIMMLGPEKSAVVVRTKDGLQRKVEPRKLSQKWSPKKLPFIRGIFNFCTSMKTGVSALMYSADFFAEEDEDEKGKEPGRFEAWLEKRLSSEKAQNALITFSVVLGLAFSIALFFVLPSLLGSFLNRFVTTNEIVRNLLEGLLRIVIFLAYMFLVSRMKDMRRVFSYHGAEHKTIRCYEAKLPLTVENARKNDPPAPALRHKLPVRRDDRLHSGLFPCHAAAAADHGGHHLALARGHRARGAEAPAPADRRRHQL